jgi:hypothetical protein
MESYKDELIAKIKTLIETIWERKITSDSLERWLNNFSGKCLNESDEKLSALYLLSQFMYFGNREMRELLRALYRDLYRYPIIAEIRKENNDTKDIYFLNNEFIKELHNTKFLGVGNPSESGTHLLYYFRQENSLPKNLFIHTHHIFKRYPDSSISIRFPNISRYVFIDDLCGSGSQAIEYSKDIIEDLKATNRNAKTAYYVLFAIKDGIDNVRKYTEFDHVEAIFELDKTYECFNDNSRYFVNPPENIDNNNSKSFCEEYGTSLWRDCPLGYKNCQLLLGFYHNVPDNTLPIIWCDSKENGDYWSPIFRRYPKIYS